MVQPSQRRKTHYIYNAIVYGRRSQIIIIIYNIMCTIYTLYYRLLYAQHNNIIKQNNVVQYKHVNEKRFCQLHESPCTNIYIRGRAFISGSAGGTHILCCIILWNNYNNISSGSIVLEFQNFSSHSKTPEFVM